MYGYLICAGLGVGVGLAELIARYRDRPSALASMPSTWLYVVVNGLASVAALLLVHVFGWTFGTSGSAIVGTQVLVAGFGAIALFRSSLFTVRVGDTDVGVGPSTVLTVFLAAADRDIDRHRAKERSRTVSGIMRGVSFARAQNALPVYCLALLQNLPTADQVALRQSVDALAAVAATDPQRALSLGLLLMNVAGEDVLRAAVKALGDDIKARGV